MSLLDSTLARLKKDKHLIDVWRERLTDKNLGGIITDYTEQFIYLSLFQNDGQNDGISIIRRADVTRIHWEGTERTSIQALIDHKQSQPLTPELNLDSIRTIIESVYNTFGYVSLYTEELDPEIMFIGSVLDIDDSHVLLNGFGTMRSPERDKTMLALSEITSVDAHSPYDQDIAYLDSRTNNPKE